MTSKVPSEVQDVLEEANKKEVAELFMSLNDYSITNPAIIKKLKSVELDPDTFTKAAKAAVTDYYDWKPFSTPTGDEQAEKFSFFKINSFLNAFTNHLNRYALTSMQLKVLSHIGFRSDYSGSQPDLTMTKIAKDLGLNFTTVQRCIEKLGDGYTYKFPNGKEVTKEGSGLVKHEKPEDMPKGREGSISISTKGKRFLEDIGGVVADYSTPPAEKIEAVRQMNFDSKKVKLIHQGKLTSKQIVLIQKLGKAMKQTNYIINFENQGGEKKKNERRKSK